MPSDFFWRSLAEEADPDRVTAKVGEFPEGADELDGATRRDFLKLLGGTAALAGLAGCVQSPPDRVMPYARQPPEQTPGIPLHFATTLVCDGFGLGVVVSSNEGRPTKVEGNPDHPASLGATGPIEQGAVQQLYDPQRARTVKGGGKPLALRALLGELARRAGELKTDGGRRLRFLCEPSGSPLEDALRQKLAEAFPRARFYAWAPVGQAAAYEGTTLAFGRPLETRLDLEAARTIVSLDADFLGGGPFRVRYQRGFATHRVPENGLNRLYVAEAAFSITGSSADHRLRLRSVEVESLALALLSELAPDRAAKGAGPYAGHPWVKAAAADLKQAGRAALVVAGPRQPALVHAAAAACNEALASGCVSYTAPVLHETATGPSALRALADEIKAGAVDTLVITAYNPVYSAPADLDFQALLQRVPNVLYRALFEDETARHARWFVPAAHALESWGDARAVDGTISIIQPLIAPLFNGVTTAEVYAAFLGMAARGPHKLLKELWHARAKRPDFERWWEDTLQRGVVEDSALEPETVTVLWDALARAVKAAPHAAAGAGTLELNLVPDAKIHDGRYADNAWLQELPDPMTKLTWGNAALMSGATAKRLDLRTEDVVELALGGQTVTAPVLIVPGHADESVSLALGYGRAGTEMIARDIGANASRLRSTAAPWFALGVTVGKTAYRQKLSITQEHWSMENRPIALDVTAGELGRKHLPILDSQREEPVSLYPAVEYAGYKWAMSVDMSRCTGCSACVMACETENNILVVGADQVRRGREMAWIRIDRYFTGPPEAPQTVMQPMMCVHCENAPCEYVCPVNATVHSDEGLNEMVYNRCVGTRYCSNNCPYKVRRFNYLDWRKNLQDTERMGMNPDVTVRSRGVMEKCTYCVQRIERARITTRIEGREIDDQELTTACAQVCPSQAIVFGTLSNPEARVTKQHEDRRAYRVLNTLGTRPRTAHLARVRNPNPALAT